MCPVEREMTRPFPELKRTALLSMDMQAAIVSIYTKDNESFLPRAAGVLEKARGSGMQVMHVQVGFRLGLPEVSTRNQLFGAIKASAQWQQVFQGPSGAIHPDVAPRGEEVVVTKHRVSAFAGTDLEMVLRAQEIDTLVLQGIATSGVVLATLLHASDADYRLFVIKDCCADRDPELHACLIDKFFPRMATVLTAAEFEQALLAP
jgi:nicotinamidase-related amidase